MKNNNFFHEVAILVVMVFIAFITCAFFTSCEKSTQYFEEPQQIEMMDTNHSIEAPTLTDYHFIFEDGTPCITCSETHEPDNSTGIGNSNHYITTESLSALNLIFDEDVTPVAETGALKGIPVAIKRQLDNLVKIKLDMYN